MKRERERGRKIETLFLHLQNLELTRSLEYKAGEVVTLLNLGTTYELLNKLDQAIEWYTLVSSNLTNSQCDLFNLTSFTLYAVP